MTDIVTIEVGLQGPPGPQGPRGAPGTNGTNWTVTVVTSQASFDAANPAANELIVRV